MAVLKTEFNNEQFNALYPEGAERYYWNIARNQIIVDTLKGSGITDEKMLEIGCGRASVLRQVRASGFNCYGVDLAHGVPAEDLKEYVQYGVDFQTLNESFTASIKVVLLFDVLEHIEDDGAFLESVKNTFPHLTHIIITVPAFMQIWSNFDTFNGHLRRYTRSSLHELIRKAGLMQLKSSYFFHVLYLPARVFTLLGLVRRTEVRPPTKGLVSRMHQLVAQYFIAEHTLVPRCVGGTSIISVVNVN